ncbi:MAG: intramembrane metalloprotease [Monoraphidium minutum]|nr:MAG: intramembrane metalloprotease [Monoraphidium minutum]
MQALRPHALVLQRAVKCTAHPPRAGGVRGQRICRAHPTHSRAADGDAAPSIVSAADAALDDADVTSRVNTGSACSPSGRGAAEASSSAAAARAPVRRQESPAATRLLSIAAAAAGVLGSGFNVEGPWSVLEAIGVLAAIITVHECGHFLAARAQGIHVTEFSIGFGPALFKNKPEGSSVEYCLRAVPLGGYVAFPDDDPKSGFDPEDPDLLNNRPLPQRAVVISAGVIANIIFAFAVLFAQVSTVGKAENAYLPGVRVPEVTPGGIAARAGVQAGDVLLRVGDYEVRAAPDQVSAVVAAIKSHPNQTLDLVVQRGGASGGGERLQVPVVPAPGRDGKGAIGISLYTNSYIKHTKADSVGGAVEIAASEFGRITGIVLGGLRSIFTNFAGVADQLSGPVAIVAKGSEIARTDSAGLFQFCAIVNVNLAAVNLLPLPALDGGYLLLLAVEGLRGRRLPQALEQGVMASGLLMMMALGVGLVIRDTMNLL